MKNLKTIIIGIAVFWCASIYNYALQPEIFIDSTFCISCHSNLRDQNGTDVSIGHDWGSSMMAHAAKDPYWQAAMIREIKKRPKLSLAIQHECAACHMPMARYISKFHKKKHRAVSHFPFHLKQDSIDVLAKEGVSCSLCHQIKKTNLGTKKSFTAGFLIDHDRKPGERVLYGKEEIDAGRQQIMNSVTAYIPEKSEHLSSSELCASCHTLFTHAFDEKGNIVATFPEQVPYLEWKHSAYNEAMSCQECHMPQSDKPAPVSSVAGNIRSSISRHVFRGGNFFIPKLLNLFRDDLEVKAQASELSIASKRTATHLKQNAAELKIKGIHKLKDALLIDINIKNLAGHKLPTAYPSRRVWIHFRCEDEKGNVLLESGKLNQNGSIAGNDNDINPATYEPHYRTIDDGAKVQIYEAILGDYKNKVTTVLLSASQYIKDNRILPEEFDKKSAPADCAVHGKALKDDNFNGDGDTVSYRIPVKDQITKLIVSCKLYYQPIGYRWAINTADTPSAETKRFVTGFKRLAPKSALKLAFVKKTFHIKPE